MSDLLDEPVNVVVHFPWDKKRQQSPHTLWRADQKVQVAGTIRQQYLESQENEDGHCHMPSTANRNFNSEERKYNIVKH